MIRRGLAALWLVLAVATAAPAETVLVRSGDHADFARLVLQHDAAIDWTVARTSTGYVFRPGKEGVTYDLSQVWRLIPRSRLAEIRPAEAGGGLELTMACACHALPFEMRPGVVVIDIRDGPPPPGSSFELPESAALPPDPAAATGGDVRAGYDWLELPAPPARNPVGGPLGVWPALAGSAAPTPDAATGARPAGDDATPPASAGADLDEMRAALLRQVGRGLTQGVLDPAAPAATLPGDSPAEVAPVATDPAPTAGGAALQDQIRILDPDGDALVNDGSDPPTADPGSMTAVGATCLSDAALALQDWGAETPPAQTLGLLATGLVGEFDRPDRAAVRRALRYLLHLGFGAEARQLAAQMAPDDPDRPIWTSLAHILDGNTDPQGAFRGMEVCDTAAALWALLGADRAPMGQTVATGAALRAFSALPVHLRRHLGPTLADRFTARGDDTAVQAIRDAILRAPGDPGDNVRLMEAARALTRGDPGSVEALTDLTAASGTTGVAATITLLRDAAARGIAPPDGLMDAAEAMRREYRGAPQEAELTAALALAQAALGDFAAAFDLADAALPETPAEVWAMLARAPDAALLTHAILAPGAAPPALSADTDRAVARRLIDLGFPGPALAWLGPARRPTGLQPDDLVLIAEAALARRDGAAALRALDGLSSDAAEALRQRANALTGDPAAPSGASPDAQFRAALRGQDWPTLAATGPDPWRAAAARVVDPGPAGAPAMDLPSLSEGRALLIESAEARAALQALLDAARP